MTGWQWGLCRFTSPDERNAVVINVSAEMVAQTVEAVFLAMMDLEVSPGDGKARRRVHCGAAVMMTSKAAGNGQTLSSPAGGVKEITLAVPFGRKVALCPNRRAVWGDVWRV